jgi:hypothetical protein
VTERRRKALTPRPRPLAGETVLLLLPGELGHHGVDRLGPSREKLPGIEAGRGFFAKYTLSITMTSRPCRVAASAALSPERPPPEINS